MRQALSAVEERETAVERRNLRLGLGVLMAESLALGLLWLGQEVHGSLGLPVAIALVAWNWRLILRGANRLVQDVRRVIAVLGLFGGQLKARVMSRRTWRFRVSTLLLAVLLIALPCAWYSHRVHQVQRERSLLN